MVKWYILCKANASQWAMRGDTRCAWVHVYASMHTSMYVPYMSWRRDKCFHVYWKVHLATKEGASSCRRWLPFSWMTMQLQYEGDTISPWQWRSIISCSARSWYDTTRQRIEVHITSFRCMMSNHIGYRTCDVRRNLSWHCRTYNIGHFLMT